jgi:hypothetical protein
MPPELHGRHFRHLQGRVALTRTGEERYRETKAAIDEVTGRLYAGLPAEDLATTVRILTTITERAEAALSATPTIPE